MIGSPERTRLAVLGSPIAHSRSPQLHAAAYRELGLDWTYERREVTEGTLAAFVAGLDDGWRGLSVTMPLKAEALACAARITDVAEETGAVNTLLLGMPEGILGFNTDVYGIMRALRDAGIERVDSVLLLGAGATARSVVSAVRRLGAASVTTAARRAPAAADLASYAETLGAVGESRRLDEALPSDVDLVVNTIPGGAAADIAFDARLTERALFEIAYDPWPSPLVSRWSGPVVSGLDMLVHQALAQVRIFVTGDPHEALPDEERVLAAMRAAAQRESAPPAP